VNPGERIPTLNEMNQKRGGSRKRALESHRKLIVDIGKRLGIGENLEAWYKVTEADLLRHGGINLGLAKRTSLYKLLNALYREHEWDPSKFKQFRQKREFAKVNCHSASFELYLMFFLESN
jgi:hypothetical protein